MILSQFYYKSSNKLECRKLLMYNIMLLLVKFMTLKKVLLVWMGQPNLAPQGRQTDNKKNVLMNCY